MILRPATLSDAELLLDWRNDPETRAMSRDSKPVTLEGHKAWLSRRLAADDPHLYVAEIDSVPVGTVRIDGDEISYTVAPVHRGKGVATSMLIAAKERFGTLRAEIKTHNIASIRAAEKAGHQVHLI